MNETTKSEIARVGTIRGLLVVTKVLHHDSKQDYFIVTFNNTVIEQLKTLPEALALARGLYAGIEIII